MYMICIYSVYIYIYVTTCIMVPLRGGFEYAFISR